MPDPSKFSKLREIGYTVPVTCGICQSGRFKSQSMWGHCTANRYQHGKHTGERELGVHRYGTCKRDPQPSPEAAPLLQSYLEFAAWLQSETSPKPSSD